MSTVNDLMKYLNATFALKLPVLPLGRFTKALTALWQATAKNWISGKPPPSTVEIDLPEPVDFPIGGGKLRISAAHLSITLPKDPESAAKSGAKSKI